jgi:hypothetical protein
MPLTESHRPVEGNGIAFFDHHTFRQIMMTNSEGTDRKV